VNISVSLWQKKGRIMKIRNYKELRVAQTPHGINAYKLYDKDHALIMHLHLKAGESLKPHITPVDVAFYVNRKNYNGVIWESYGVQ
jgi:hypothetical protein